MKPASIVELERTGELLREHFGDSTPIDAITVDGAHDWRVWLQGKTRTRAKRKGKGKARPFTEATLRKFTRYAKVVFRAACKRKLIADNPFDGLTAGTIAAKRNRHITTEETESIIAALPDAQYRTLFGLARYAGLRCPSETHLLSWGDVDWERGRLHVRSPKTERYANHRERTVPIVPRLRELLLDGFADAEEGAETVLGITRTRIALHRVVGAAVKRAGIEPIARVFQTCRQSRETDWARTHPQHAVSAWLGHSVAVGVKHYLTVTDELLDAAAGLSEGAA